MPIRGRERTTNGAFRRSGNQAEGQGFALVAALTDGAVQPPGDMMSWRTRCRPDAILTVRLLLVPFPDGCTSVAPCSRWIGSFAPSRLLRAGPRSLPVRDARSSASGPYRLVEEFGQLSNGGPPRAAAGRRFEAQPEPSPCRMAALY